MRKSFPVENLAGDERFQALHEREAAVAKMRDADAFARASVPSSGSVSSPDSGVA